MLSSAPRSASRASLARRDELRDEDRDDPRDEPRGARALLGLFSDEFSGVESSFIGSRMGSCIGSCNCCARSSAVVDSEGWCLCSIHDAYMRVNHHETLVWHPTSTCLCMFLHTRVVRARCPTRACECAIFRAISQARTHHSCVLLTSQPCVAPHVRFVLLRTACAIPTICGEPSRSFRARPSPKNLCSGRSTRVGLVVAERCTLRTTSDEHPIPDLLRLPCEGRTSDEVAYLAEFKAKDKNKL